MELSFTELKDAGDARGSSFSVPVNWLADAFSLRDVHITTIRPGHTRGNHYHEVREEIFVILFSDRWSLHWDSGKDTAIVSCDFDGAGAVIVKIPPRVSHAIRNDGNELLRMVGLTDHIYDASAPDVFPRKVAEP